MEAEEKAAADAMVLHHTSPYNLTAVNAFSKHSAKSTFAQGLHRPTASKMTEPVRGSPTSAVPCGNCGRPGHVASDPSCSACGKQCINHSKTGHFACCCRSKSAKQKSGHKQKQPSKQKACMVEKSGHTSDAIFGTVQLDRVGLSTPFSLRAQSQCTGITHYAFNQSFPHDTLQQLTDTLHNFDGSPIMCVQGFFESQVHFPGRMHWA